MKMKIYQVDAFTSEPFRGNPAAVCLLDAYPTEEWMQAVAGEMNLPETAFIVPRDDGFRLRWFTPESEIDLCGHATLASAHILWEKGVLPSDKEANFYTRSGLLTAKMSEAGIQLDFPVTPSAETEAPDKLIEALGVTPLYVGKSIYDYLIEVESEDIVRQVNPDFLKLLDISMRGVIVTSRSQSYDFVSRFFAPGIGVKEDPVTGSTHCCLGPYWQQKTGRYVFRAYQASARGGELQVKVAGDRVMISGKAVTVLEGNLTMGI